MELEVGTFEAKNKLSELVERASRGDRIWITRRGKRMALLSSGSGTSESMKAKPSLVERARRIREQSRPGPSIRELIDEGRRC